ncbi:hypothetical protein FXO38_25159 [Capsicum annuum]|nr:hypothetical protein FXO38_25159 [Capsicum annuum]KAF3636984.1 hypothetical protein FXO37_25153 [Capsicum annuum]
MDEIWVNYYGMLVCFSLQEFTIVMGLRCHQPEEPPIAKGISHKRYKARKSKEKIDGLFDIARRGYKASELLTDLMDKTIPKQYREKLCLVWFSHLVILARDVNKVWAFETIPPLRKQVMDYPNEVSHLRIFRWLTPKNNIKIKEANIFNLLNDAVVHPWIVPTERESMMTSYITLGYVDTIADSTVELIKKELAGATTIRRAVRQGQPNVEALHDQSTMADPGASSGGVVGVGGRYTDAATTRDNDHIDV